LLSRLQYLVEALFESSAGFFKKAGISANAITVAGFLLTIVASFFYGVGLPSWWSWLGATLGLLVSGYFDALDGAMARRFLQVSKVGGVLDSVLDRIGEIALYSGLAFGGLVDFRIAFWALSAALMVSYIRARVEAEGRTLKGVGLAERPERLLVLLLFTILFPLYRNSLAWGVGIVAVLASLTVAERLYRAVRLLSAENLGIQ
jgi:archaetidylinositol phosphate synthase